MIRVIICLIALPSIPWGQNDFLEFTEEFKREATIVSFVVDTLKVSVEALRELANDLTILSYKDSNMVGVVERGASGYRVSIRSLKAETRLEFKELRQEPYRIWYHGHGSADTGKLLGEGGGEILISVWFLPVTQGCGSVCTRVTLSYWIKTRNLLVKLAKGKVRKGTDREFSKALKHIERAVEKRRK